VVPDEVLLASLEETPRAVRLLGGLVDYCVAIDNDGGGEPRLLGGCGREGGREGGGDETWTTFSGVWRDCGLPARRGWGGEGGREGKEEGKG